MSPGFLDTNVLVYAFSSDARSNQALELLESGQATGVQNLNEFVSVAVGKLKKDWDWTREALDRIRLLCSFIVPLDLPLHEHGAATAERYKLHIYDALVVAAALRYGSAILWSEDMQDGMIIEGLLTIRNPFAASRTN